MEAVVACGEKMSDGISTLDPETGEELRRIPTCSSPPRGLLLCAPNLLVASQLQNHRPSGGGAIFCWDLNKPQTPRRSYTIETIEPIACSKDGVYLVGGAPSGNAYVWEVTSGRLLKRWHAHQRSVSCFAFSDDDSILISGSEDGTICVWFMISVLNIEDSQTCGSVPFFRTSSEHGSCITGLQPICGGSNLRLISGSLDGTCKVWCLLSGSLLQTSVFPAAVTTIAVDPTQNFLFSGCMDGRIYVSNLTRDGPILISEDEAGVLCGHKGPITALTFSSEGLWLVSASKDCTACLWDAENWRVIRRFTHGRKGCITNLLVIPRSSLSKTENQRACRRVSILDKTPLMNLASEGTVTLLPQYCSDQQHFLTTGFRTSNLLQNQILDLEQGRTAEAIQMKVEASVESRLLAVAMTKHVTSINKHLRSRLVDMMKRRLGPDSEAAQGSVKES